MEKYVDIGAVRRGPHFYALYMKYLNFEDTVFLSFHASQVKGHIIEFIICSKGHV